MPMPLMVFTVSGIFLFFVIVFCCRNEILLLSLCRKWFFVMKKCKQHKKRRLFSSLSFRINMVLIVILVIVGWLFIRSVTFGVSLVTNGNRQINMSRMITASIDNRLNHIENVMKTGALVALQKRMTEHNSTIFRDSLGKMDQIDTVYLSTNKLAEVEAVKKCLARVDSSGVGMWSEPYLVEKDSTKVPVVSFITPLKNSRGNIYSSLCANVRLDWLDELARREVGHESGAKVSVITGNDIYVYYTDSDRIMKNAKNYPADFENNGENVALQVYSNIQEFMLRSGNAYVKATGWRVVCDVPLRDDTVLLKAVTGISIFTLLLLFFIIILAIVITVNWQLRPLGKIADATDAIAQGKFDTQLPKVKGHSDIAHLRDSFVSMQQELARYIEDLRATTEKKANMERDLHIAAKIQQGMLLKVFPAFPGREDIDIYGMQRAAKEVGGDIFDFLMRDDRLYFLIGDVSGKGVPASLFMTVVGHLFRNVARYSTSASIIVEAINNGLAEGNDEDMFCTLFCGVLDMQTGRVEFCNAGHNPPIWIHEGNTSFMHPEVNLPTGVLGDYEYKSEEIQLSEGDALFLYTDGVTEAENSQKALFGDASTLAMVDLLKDVPMMDMADGVVDAIRRFVDDYEQSDDLTMLCLRWRGKKAVD